MIVASLHREFLIMRAGRSRNNNFGVKSLCLFCVVNAQYLALYKYNLRVGASGGGAGSTDSRQSGPILPNAILGYTSSSSWSISLKC